MPLGAHDPAAGEGKMTDAHAAIAKAFTTSKCRETVAWARELLAGNGIDAEYNVRRSSWILKHFIPTRARNQMQN